MDEQQPQVTPPSAPTQALTLWQRMNQSFADLWAKDKLLLILLGVVIVIVKFRGILIDLIVASSKKLVNNTVAQDTALAKQENDAKAKADDLVKQAEAEPSKEEPVKPDWYKK